MLITYTQISSFIHETILAFPVIYKKFSRPIPDPLLKCINAFLNNIKEFDLFDEDSKPGIPAFQ